MNVSNKGIYSLRPQKCLTSVNLTIKNYYSIHVRKGNKNTSAFALKYVFACLSLKIIYCFVFDFME